MIPKVLLNLIDKYNEKGIFVLKNNAIYWFNGNRYELWCESEEYLTIQNIWYSKQSIFGCMLFESGDYIWYKDHWKRTLKTSNKQKKSFHMFSLIIENIKYIYIVSDKNGTVIKYDGKKWIQMDYCSSRNQNSFQTNKYFEKLNDKINEYDILSTNKYNNDCHGIIQLDSKYYIIYPNGDLYYKYLFRHFGGTYKFVKTCSSYLVCTSWF